MNAADFDGKREGDLRTEKLKYAYLLCLRGDGSTNVEPVGIDDKEKEFRLLDIDLFQQASI